MEEENEEQIELVNKNDLIGHPVHVLHMSEERLGTYGFYKIVYGKMADKKIKFFISSQSVLDNPKIVGIVATIVKNTTKDGAGHYFSWRSINVKDVLESPVDYIKRIYGE